MFYANELYLQKLRQLRLSLNTSETSQIGGKNENMRTNKFVGESDVTNNGLMDKNNRKAKSVIYNVKKLLEGDDVSDNALFSQEKLKPSNAKHGQERTTDENSERPEDSFGIESNNNFHPGGKRLLSSSKEEKPGIMSTLKSIGSTVLTAAKNLVQKNDNQINPHNFNYIFNEENLCQRKGRTDSIFVMIVILSAPYRFEQRQAIRDTWGSAISQENLNVRLAFMLGTPEEKEFQVKIEQESKTHHDIIQEDFLDTYQNLSLKSAGILKWTHTYCGDAKYLFKVDDDMFAHIPNLVKTLRDSGPKFHRFIMGSVIEDAKPIRDPNSKWFVSTKDFSKDIYPVYVSGTAYVVSSDVIYDLYKTTLTIPAFPLEDVYITGLCAQKVNASRINHGGFTFLKRETGARSYANYITGHRINSKELYRIWNSLKNENWTCS